MPTYVTIEFIHDFSKSKIVRTQGRTAIIWKSIHSVGDRLQLTFDKAHHFVKEGYAKYVH